MHETQQDRVRVQLKESQEALARQKDLNAHLNALLKEERAAYAESKRMFEDEIRQLSERIKMHDASVSDANG